MRKPKLLIALAVSGALTTGFGSSVLTASADVRTLRVTLLSGEVRTLQVDVPPGTPAAQLAQHLPDVGEPVVEVVDLTPAPQAQAPAAPAPPAGAPAEDEAQDAPAAPQRSDDSAEGEDGEAADGEDAQGGQGGAPEAGAPAGEGAEQRETAPQAPAAPAPAAAQAPASPAAPQPGPADQPATDQAAALTPPEGVPNFFIERFRIPPFLLPIYQAAGIQYGVRWEVLAAINEIETDYGRNLNVSTAGAVGWMQFMPASWRAYGVDANGDREKDPYNPADAIFAAARYLRAAGADRDLRAAIWAYNHADWYVDSVLLRARLIAGMPTDLVGSLSGLTQGLFPVAARARYEDEVTARTAREADGPAVTVEGDEARTGIDVESRPRARAVAVQDGTVVAIGRSERLGRYVRLRDAYGNEYTYGGLGDVADRVLVPEERTPSAEEIARELRLPKRDPRPDGPASAGRQRKASASAGRATGSSRARRRAGAATTKERLFAHPRRPEPWRNGGRRQVASERALPDDVPLSRWFSLDLGLERDDFELRRLVVGRRVVAGTVLGRLADAPEGERARLRFEIRPAGRGAPRIDPKPILDGWRLLATTAILRADGDDPFRAIGTPSVGQLLLMSKEQLQRRVLGNERIEIYACGRRDIEAGIIDRRVLATLEYLAASGLEPTVSSLRCGHGVYTASGNVSHHTTGSALDIAAVNGVPIQGNQGPGSVTDQTIRRLLALQGTMRPAQIISLMDYEGADNTIVMADHADHIHVGFRPTFDPDSKEARELAAVLEPGQWIDLVDRLGSIENPTVRTTPSKASVRVGG